MQRNDSDYQGHDSHFSLKWDGGKASRIDNAYPVEYNEDRRKEAMMMCSQHTLQEILEHLCEQLRELLGASMQDVILFGSYARNDADEESDIDIMILTDMDRTDISALQWQIGEIASDILLDYGVLVAPIVENRTFFLENQEIMPFFRNINKEGVRISA